MRQLLNTVWRLLWLGRDYRDMAWLAIGTLSANERHGGTIGNGVELTVWKFPADSKYADAAALLPVENEATRAAPTVTSNAGTPTTQHWIDLKDGGRSFPQEGAET